MPALHSSPDSVSEEVAPGSSSPRPGGFIACGAAASVIECERMGWETRSPRGGTTMPTVRLIEEHEATGKVKEVFEDIKATKEIDFVPNVWRALAVNPDHLELAWNKLKAIMRPGRLDLLTKEIIALAVSITNGCPY
jgi:hypothetical protein